MSKIDWTRPGTPIGERDEGPEAGDIVRCECCRFAGELGTEILDAPDEFRGSPRYMAYLCPECIEAIRAADSREIAADAYHDMMREEGR
jgi:predicted RNA-binding Zn-ribbon protein involved in translation (DUF1610 family)